MRAFGLRTQTDADAWRLLDPPPKEWYFTAITRRPGVEAGALANARGMVCDAWSRLDLGPLGFERRHAEPWFFRPSGPLPPQAAPPELEILPATMPQELAFPDERSSPTEATSSGTVNPSGGGLA